MGDPTKIFTGTGEVIFSGSAINYGIVQTATVIFQGTAVNDGAIDASDLVRFTDDSRNLDVVECPIIEILQTASNAGQLKPLTRVLFADSAENESGGKIDSQNAVAVFGGSVIINGEVKAATITVSGNATNNASMVASVKVEFLDSASNTASITGTAVFKGNASNDGGSVVGNLSLFGNATNSGSVQGDIELNDNASNSGPSSGNVITYTGISLNGTGYLYSGVLSSGVTIIVDGNKTAVPNISGTDTIDGQSSNWSTDGSGVLTYSAVDNGGGGSINHQYNTIIEDIIYYHDIETLADGDTLYISSTSNTLASNNVGIMGSTGNWKRYAIANGVISISNVHSHGDYYGNSPFFISSTVLYNSQGVELTGTGIITPDSSNYYRYSSLGAKSQVYKYGNNYGSLNSYGGSSLYKSDGTSFIPSSITLDGSTYHYDNTLASGIEVWNSTSGLAPNNSTGSATIGGVFSDYSIIDGILTYSASNLSAPTITSISADDETPAKYTTENNDGGSFTITVVADDGGDTQNISYQWQVLAANWQNILGATQSTYSSDTNSGNINNTTTQYRCVVTNSVGSAESNSITITPVDAYGTILSTTTNSITVIQSNGTSQSGISNGVTNTIADGNGGSTTVAVYPDLGDQLHTYTDITVSVGYGGLSQTVTYNYLADGNGGYTEDAVYPAAGLLLGTYSSDIDYSVYITEMGATHYFTVNVNADGNGGYILLPQNPTVGEYLGGTTGHFISLPYNLQSYTYTLSYLSNGNGGYTVSGHPTSADKLTTVVNAGSITTPAGTVYFDIGYWGDGMGGYTAINEIIDGTYLNEDSAYKYYSSNYGNSYDSVAKES